MANTIAKHQFKLYIIAALLLLFVVAGMNSNAAAVDKETGDVRLGGNITMVSDADMSAIAYQLAGIEPGE